MFFKSKIGVLKKIFILFFLFGFRLCFICLGKDELNPIAHYKPLDGWVGDVHPVYWNGEWHIFYLETPNEPLRAGLFRIHSADAVSKDLIHWTERTINNPEINQPWWSIANIVYEGKCYSYCNGNKGFDLYISEDFENWTPYENNPVIPYDYTELERIRDPSIFWNEKNNEFWMIITVKKKGIQHRFYSGAFYHSISKDLFNWSKPQLLFDPGNINEPECPELFMLNNKYYLIGSWGTTATGKGRYFISDSPNGPWLKAKTDSFDGDFFLAPNSAFDLNRRLTFAWIPTLKDNKDYESIEWGGHLSFAREIWAGDDGALYTKLPEEYTALRNELLLPKNEIKPEKMFGGKWSINKDSIELPKNSKYSEIWLQGEYPRFELNATITFQEDCPNAGFLFRLGNDKFSGYEVSIDQKHSLLIFRHHLERSKIIASQTIFTESRKDMELRIFVDGSIIECFLDNRFSLAARAYTDKGSYKIGFYSENGGFKISNIKVYSLKDVYQEASLPPINLYPEPDSKHNSGKSILFPKLGANIYTPYDPVLNFSDSFTLECWVKVTKGTAHNKANLIVKGERDIPGYHYGLNLTRTNSLEFYFKSTTGFEGLSAQGNLITEGQWHHLAGVLDSNQKEIRLYINGKRVATKQNVQNKLDANNLSPLRLGIGAGFSMDQFLGLIDEVRLWNVARTDDEISANYNKSIATDSKGLVVHWNFDSQEGAEQEYYPNLVKKHSNIKAKRYDGSQIQNENCK